MGLTGTANSQTWPLQVGHDLSTSYGTLLYFPVKQSLFLTLWDDVIEVPPNPKLYVYQRPIPGCTCGTKGLRVFARRVARGALTVFINSD